MRISFRTDFELDEAHEFECVEVEVEASVSSWRYTGTYASSGLMGSAAIISVTRLDTKEDIIGILDDEKIEWLTQLALEED